MNTEEIDNAIMQLCDDASDEQIAEALDKLDYIKRFEREAREKLKSRMLERIQATRRDIVIGTKRFYAGIERETKPKDNAAVLTALIVAMGGDLEAVGRDALKSDPFKLAAARQAITPENFAELFETKEKVVLKDGKPQKQLLCTDERFIKGTSRNLPEVADGQE